MTNTHSDEFQGVVYRPERRPPSHGCRPPVDRSRLHSHPREPVGTVWQCTCGKRWVVRLRTGSGDWRRKRPRWVRKYLPHFGSSSSGGDV